MNLIYHKKIDEILNKVIDKNYVLINTSLTNRVLRDQKNKKNLHLENLGNTWHHDSRFVGEKKLDKGFGFITCMMFNDFTKSNGGTQYVPKSHLIRKNPKRFYNYNYKQIVGKAGTIVIIDSGLWHRAGNSISKENRWSVFSNYGPWFIKPYYRYTEMLGKNFKKKISYKLQKLFHYHSIPPINELERVKTLT
jgi:Protein involved in biosynthesis of mitomycin antibiotics/polyketide fumonisin